jgi:hypothetical protein
MPRPLGPAALAALLLVAACQRDAPRDVQPMSAPLRGAPSGQTASTGTMALEDVRKSQAGTVAQRIADTDITITYSRPVARGRDLFGALVPYDRPWNPGADRATAITVTRDVQVNGMPLPAGSYSLWAIPRADVWTIVFSRAADVFHTPYPGEKHDALRLDVGPEAGPHMETLLFSFPVVDGKEATLRLHWGTVMVPLSIRVP